MHANSLIDTKTVLCPKIVEKFSSITKICAFRPVQFDNKAVLIKKIILGIIVLIHYFYWTGNVRTPVVTFNMSDCYQRLN